MINSFKSYTLLVESKDIIDKFIKFCNSSLDIQTPCEIGFVEEPEAGMTTGCFNPMTREIKVLSGKRALVDVLRSLAHELVHARQHEQGRLKPGAGDDGSPIENEANSLAGVIMRRFQRHNRDIYDL
jgi:hypothetical protein